MERISRWQSIGAPLNIRSSHDRGTVATIKRIASAAAHFAHREHIAKIKCL